MTSVESLCTICLIDLNNILNKLGDRVYYYRSTLILILLQNVW